MKRISVFMPLMGAAGYLDYLSKDPEYMQGGLRAFQNNYEFHPRHKKLKYWQMTKKRVRRMNKKHNY